MSQAAGRTARRRAATMEEILDHAQDMLDEAGAGAVTVSEVARRMGMRPPSLYKHLSSLHDLYDGLFARGQQRLLTFVLEATEGCEPGLESLLEGHRAFLRWTTRERGLAALMLWRPVPGFEPGAAGMAVAQELLTAAREQLRIAVGRGELEPAADSDEAARLLTVLVGGIFTQQAANQPGAGFDEGLFTSLTDDVLDLFVTRYRTQPGRTPS